tara:strand:+ start:46 stop:426 length:381 start_codon:yes stop_codon:yes gene_type:complete
MGFLGMGKSKWNKLGRKAKKATLGASKGLVTAGKIGVTAGKIGAAIAPELAVASLALGQPEGVAAAKMLGAGSAVAIEEGRAAKNLGRVGRENIRGHHNSKKDKKRLQKASKQAVAGVGAATLGFA